jgi:hypothetical protein
MDPHFLDLGTSWRWVVSFTSLPLYPRERAPGIHFIRGWVNPRSGLDHMEKWKFLTLPEIELPPPGRPARSQSLSVKKMEHTARGCNWATLFLGDINTGTWPPRLGGCRIWDSNLKITALARASRNCKRQTRPLVRNSIPQQTRNWQQQRSGLGSQMGFDTKTDCRTDHWS